jgi:hypothetical protein
MPRKTVNRETIVQRANAMLSHLAESGTHDDAIRREAIAAIVSSILLAGAPNDAYKGFRYMNPPAVADDGTKTYDETRITFY